MFTVKVRDSDGSERLYLASTVEKIQRGDRFEDGIYLDRTPESASHIITFTDPMATASTLPEASICWVMNEQGATVATYHL